MRKFKRLLLLALALVTVMSCMLVTAQAAWKKDSKGWYYVDQHGKRITNTWQKDSKGWVYLDANGYMVTNKWVRDSVGWCYVGADGYAVTNCWKKDSVGWCYLNANGSMTKNKWVKDGGKWYFLDANGYMVTNKWSKDSVGWVYCGADGAMLTNAWCKDSKGWCYVGADGYAVTNTWKKDSVGWVYLDSEGSMVYNKWIDNDTYYVGANGYMVVGWQTIGGDKYYFHSSGAKAVNTTVDGITLGADGKAQNGGSAVTPDPVKPDPAPKNAQLTVGISQNAYVRDYDMNALTMWLEEETGYEITFVIYSGNDVSSQIANTIAIGQQLPDILFGMNLNANTVNTYGQNGYFVDLTDYYKDAAGASKNFWTRIETELTEAQMSQVIGALTDPVSGRIYSVPTVQKSPSTQAQYQPYINQAWLDKLGLSMPTNTEELYNVLKAFKEQDPNGNGVKDEIPLMGSSKVLGGDVVSWLINMFMYYDPSNPYQPYGYGDIAAGYTQDAYRQAIMFVNRLYEEGLLTSMILTVTSSEMRNIVTPANGVALCGIFCGNPKLVARSDSPIIQEYAAMPLWGYAVETPVTVKANTFITADCDEPAAAFKLLMALWSYEGSTRVRYGEYEVNWTQADEGSQSDYGLAANIKLLSDPSLEDHNAHWGVTACCFLPYANGEDLQTVATDGIQQHIFKLQADSMVNFADAQDENNPYFVCQTSLLRLDDQDTVNQITTDLTTICKQHQANFIVGIYDPANDSTWNQYLTELNDVGLTTLMTEMQEAYRQTWSCQSITNHFFLFSSCAEDGSCVFCSSTNSLAHGHKFEDSTCVYCGTALPTLTSGRWQHIGVTPNGGELDRTYISFDEGGEGTIGASYYGLLEDGLDSEEYLGVGYITYNGKLYQDLMFGDGGSMTYTVSGDTVTMHISFHGEAVGTLTLQKSAPDRYKVVAITGDVIDSTVTSTIPIGSEFIWY